jgi:hypothetical protein
MSEATKKSSSTARIVMKAVVCLFLVGWLVLAIQGLIPHHELAHRAMCINKLGIVAEAKKEWVSEHHAKPGDIVTMNDIVPYIHSASGSPPSCPDGIITVGRVGDLPTCSFPGHVLAPKQTNSVQDLPPQNVKDVR